MTKKARNSRKAERKANRLIKNPLFQSVRDEMYKDLLIYGYVDIQKYEKMLGIS